MRLIDAEPIEQTLFRRADKALAKNPYANARVCAFRQAFELILDAPTIAPPPNDPPLNDPLTLEELWEMDGEPVWTEALDGGVSRWAFADCGCELVRFFKTRQGVACEVIARHFKTYGKTWLAYRRKPEEG